MKLKETRILDVERAHKLAQMDLDNLQTKYKNSLEESMSLQGRLDHLSATLNSESSDKGHMN